MPQKVFDDPAVRDAMRSYLRAAERLDEAAGLGGEPRDLLDLAESKAMAGLMLRKALERHGWTGPSRERADEPEGEPEPAT
jgi:hypothetical protein